MECQRPIIGVPFLRASMRDPDAYDSTTWRWLARQLPGLALAGEATPRLLHDMALAGEAILAWG